MVGLIKNSEDIVLHECTQCFAQEVFERYLGSKYNIYTFEPPAGHESKIAARAAKMDTMDVNKKSWLLSPDQFGFPCHRPRPLGPSNVHRLDCCHRPTKSRKSGCLPSSSRRDLALWSMMTWKPWTCCIEVSLQAAASFFVHGLNHCCTLRMSLLVSPTSCHLVNAPFLKEEVEVERKRLGNVRKKPLNSKFKKLLTGLEWFQCVRLGSWDFSICCAQEHNRSGWKPTELAKRYNLCFVVDTQTQTIDYFCVCV